MLDAYKLNRVNVDVLDPGSNRLNSEGERSESM